MLRGFLIGLLIAGAVAFLVLLCLLYRRSRRRIYFTYTSTVRRKRPTSVTQLRPVLYNPPERRRAKWRR